MAGGIDWFRWHHGTVTDQKFPLVAKRAGASVAEVIAVWACLLERASMNEGERGTLGEKVDFEAMDCALGLDDGKAEAVFNALQKRDLIDEHMQVTAWPKRQPKREDDTAAERKRRQRERDHELSLAKAVTADASCDVTQGHAELAAGHAYVTQGHDRGEESSEELSDEANASSSSTEPTKGRSAELPCPYEAIVQAYTEELPTLPGIKVMDDKRRRAIRARWVWVLSSKRLDGTRRATNGDEAMEWFRGYFSRVRANSWLMGETPSRGHENWKADLDFLMTDRGLKAVIERTEVAA